MRAARIYKDNFRENPLLSLFVADTSPLVIIGVGIAIVYGFLYIMILHFYNYRLFFYQLG